MLYRAAEKEDGQYSPEDWTPVDTKTLPAGTIPADGSDLTETLRFESTDSVSLSIYAPDNCKYVYMVIEEPVNGYESMIPRRRGRVYTRKHGARCADARAGQRAAQGDGQRLFQKTSMKKERCISGS